MLFLFPLKLDANDEKSKSENEEKESSSFRHEAFEEQIVATQNCLQHFLQIHQPHIHAFSTTDCSTEKTNTQEHQESWINQRVMMIAIPLK